MRTGDLSRHARQPCGARAARSWALRVWSDRAAPNWRALSSASTNRLAAPCGWPASCGQIASPRDAIDRGIYLVPEDRKRSGLLLDMSIAGNISLPDLPRYADGRHRRIRTAKRQCREAARQRSISARPLSRTRCGALSGGNQQKVVLAKWLSMRPRVIIFDEPTRGIDVGAKSEIYALMRELADQGVAVLMISSDMEEVIGVSDRIAVMHEGEHQRLSRTGAVQRSECAETGGRRRV